MEAIELGCGGYPGDAHCKPDALLNDEGEFKRFMKLIEKSGMTVSALSCHGNMVHPDKAVADEHVRVFKNAVLLAEKMGVDRIITFSGCPGDFAGAKYPNWVTCPWPEDFLAIRELKDCIHHFHAKDTKIDEANTLRNGVLDTKKYVDEANRSWVFRSVGYGMPETKWREMMSELVLAGYDHVVSIEHEDSLMSPEEGLEKAVSLLQRVIIKEGKPKEIWWA